MHHTTLANLPINFLSAFLYHRVEAFVNILCFPCKHLDETSSFDNLAYSGLTCLTISLVQPDPSLLHKFVLLIISPSVRCFRTVCEFLVQATWKMLANKATFQFENIFLYQSK